MADIDINHAGLEEVANAIRQENGLAAAHKRKRDSDGNDSTRSSKRISPTDGKATSNQLEALQDYSALHSDANGTTEHADNASSTATAALALYPAITIPARTEDAFAAQTLDSDRNGEFIDSQGEASYLDTPGGASGTPRSANKPTVGTDEWHKVRKDNHKEVERRRRETINEGINELAKIVPGCEKNKGSILQRAVSFIVQLKDNETQNIEKWTLEKLLTEQAIAELSASNDKLKAENERAWREVETWKKTCQSAGLAPKKDLSSAPEG